MLESLATMGSGLGPTVLAALGAGIAIAFTGLSSAKGLEVAGHSAAGVTAEEEKNFTTALILQALPQTQVVYGFIIAVIIVYSGLISGSIESIEQGWICLIAGIAVGLTGYSAAMQGRVAATSIGAAAKNQAIRSKVLIYVVMPEIAALFGFVIGLLLLMSAKLF